MRLTIIPSDQAVYKDGVVYDGLNMSAVPSNVHALQWFDVSGSIEFKDGVPNEDITELPAWADICLQEWEAADYEHKNPPAPTPEQLIERCKSEAKRRLEETDYSELPDVKAILINAADFTMYRTQVRALYLNPVTDPTWPATPKAQWSIN